MFKPERIRYRLSDTELKRRWLLVQNLLKEKEIDAVLTQNNNMFLGGYVRWFTDVPAEYNMPITVVFNQKMEILLLRSGSPMLEPYPPVFMQRENFHVVNLPYCPTLNFTADMEADVIIENFKKHNYKRVGYVNPAMLPIRFMNKIKSALPNLELIDITDEIDLFKALKSDEEMKLIRETARIHDAAWSALPSIAKPGMKEYQIRGCLIELLCNLGSEEQLIFIGTAQPGTPSGMATFEFANKTVENGDCGTLLIEVSGPGGYYCESARNYCWGDPDPEFQKMWDVAVEAQRITEKMLVPGQNSTEIVREYNKFVGSLGYSQEGRLYGHSQGYDLIERPAFMKGYEWGEECMPILEGMNVSLHPFMMNERFTAYINSNYYVHATGAEKLHKTPDKLIIL